MAACCRILCVWNGARKQTVEAREPVQMKPLVRVLGGAEKGEKRAARRICMQSGMVCIGCIAARLLEPDCTLDSCVIRCRPSSFGIAHGARRNPPLTRMPQAVAVPCTAADIKAMKMRKKCNAASELAWLSVARNPAGVRVMLVGGSRVRRSFLRR